MKHPRSQKNNRQIFQDKMEAVESSNISHLAHDEETETMMVRFHNGKVYIYWPLSKAIYNNTKKAKSVGKAFTAKVRSNKDLNYGDIGYFDLKKRSFYD